MSIYDPQAYASALAAIRDQSRKLGYVPEPHIDGSVPRGTPPLSGPHQRAVMGLPAPPPSPDAAAAQLAGMAKGVQGMRNDGPGEAAARELSQMSKGVDAMRNDGPGEAAARELDRMSASRSGQLEAGNINLYDRPSVKNEDGSTSSVRSMSFGEGGQEVLVPTVSDDGRIMGDDEAVQSYRSTGKHLGKFKTPDQATAYAEQLHKDQEKLYASGAGGDAKRAAIGATVGAPPSQAASTALGAATGATTGQPALSGNVDELEALVKQMKAERKRGDRGSVTSK